MNRTLILSACLLTAILTASSARAERFPPLPPPSPLELLLPVPPPFPFFILHERHHDDNHRHDYWRDRRDDRWERRAYRQKIRHDHREYRCEVCYKWPPEHRGWRHHRHDHDGRYADRDDHRHSREGYNRYDR